MISIKDIARACGVTPATVSKALNDRSDISEARKEEVRATAKKMGYVTSNIGRSLRTNRSNNLGVLYVDYSRSGLTHEYFSTVLESFRSAAETSGYDITFLNHNLGGKSTSFIEHCRSRSLDGVMIVTVDFNDIGVQELIKSGIPVVTLDHMWDSKTSIMSDNIHGVHELVTYIHSKGHTKIAFIHGGMTNVTQSRLLSFNKTCAELDIKIPSEYIIEGDYHNVAKAEVCTRVLLALPDPPTCIMYPDDFSYIGGMNEIRRQGLSIPNDISVVGYDGIYLSRVLAPQLTTLHQDAEALGKYSAVELIKLVEKPKTTLPTQILVKGKLLEGGSVKDIRPIKD